VDCAPSVGKLAALVLQVRLERRLYENDIPVSSRRVPELTQPMYEITFKLLGDPKR